MSVLAVAIEMVVDCDHDRQQHEDDDADDHGERGKAARGRTMVSARNPAETSHTSGVFFA